MTSRGLILGTLGFIAAVGAERLYASLAPDIARYNRMRAMSDQPPILKELLASAGGAISGSARAGVSNNIITDITHDIVRYAKMRGM
jgi:hypothetical protein